MVSYTTNSFYLQSYFSSPTWSSTPLQHKNSEKICESLNSNLDKEQFTTKNRILSQVKLNTIMCKYKNQISNS